MNYREYKMLKTGNYQSVGTIGNIYVYEVLTGFTDAPEYYQITKDEFDNYEEWKDKIDLIVKNIHNRQCLCSAYAGRTEINPSHVLSEIKLCEIHGTMV